MSLVSSKCLQSQHSEEAKAGRFVSSKPAQSIQGVPGQAGTHTQSLSQNTKVNKLKKIKNKTKANHGGIADTTCGTNLQSQFTQEAVTGKLLDITRSSRSIWEIYSKITFQKTNKKEWKDGSVVKTVYYYLLQRTWVQF